MPTSNYEDRFDAQVKLAKRLIILVVLGIFLLIIVFGSMFTVDAGERVIILTFGKPSEVIRTPGLNFKFPIVQSIIRMSIRTQTINFDNKQGTGDNSEYSSLFGASKDLQDVQIATVVNYHISEKDVLEIYKQYGNMDNYQKNVIEPIIRDTVKSTSGQFTAEELITKRLEFADKISGMMIQRFQEKSATFEKVNIVNFQFSPVFTQAIEKKVTAEQDALAAKNKLEQVKYEAEQRVAQAEAEAKAIEIQARAITSQGGRDYVELQRISRWDGHYPMVMGASSPILDMRSVAGAYSSVYNSTQ